MASMINSALLLYPSRFLSTMPSITSRVVLMALIIGLLWFYAEQFYEVGLYNDFDIVFCF